MFGHDVSGGPFANLEEAKRKNSNDENALLFSILDDLEVYRTNCGYFHFKLCYPELSQSVCPCYEWTQTSNPVLESTITGYQPIDIPFTDYPFGGLGLNRDSSHKEDTLIDHAPDLVTWWNSIGTIKFHMSQIPGPEKQVVNKSALYVGQGLGCS